MNRLAISFKRRRRGRQQPTARWQSMLLVGVLISVCGSAGCTGKRSFGGDPSFGMEQIDGYTQVAYRNHADAYNSIRILQVKVRQLLADPKPRTLAGTRQAWLVARIAYVPIEVFRAGSSSSGLDRMSAWPIDVDLIEKKPAGNGPARAAKSLLYDPAITVSRDTLLLRHGQSSPKQDQKNGQRPATLGFHVIEYLLWGPDRRVTSAGERSAEDYLLATDGQTDPAVLRRRQMLQLVTDQLVVDLKLAVDDWTPAQPNRAGQLKIKHGKEAIGEILSRLAATAHDLAERRIRPVLDNGEAFESSRFSDNTHKDWYHLAQGMENVYFGSYRRFKAPGINSLAARIDAELNQKIEQLLKGTVLALKQCPRPIDRVAMTPLESQQRQYFKAIAQALHKQVELYQQLGRAMGVDVRLDID